MSPINFDALISEHPESKRALRKLEEWLKKHGDVQAINPTILAREVRDVDPISLTSALSLLVSNGFFRLVYKVLTPSGVYTDQEFDDPRKIPEKLPDRWENYFDTAEADVIPIFKKVA